MKGEIAHPYLLAGIIGGVLLYLVWQRGQAQTAQQAMVSQANQGDALFGSTGTSTGTTSSGTTDITDLVVTPNNLNQLSSS